ncbi:oleate hydratase [Mucilaginibacter sp. BJC16-A38]|uniref:oleate hydratase n=1 Tax=Mucilaginibacter phenanthrenivorans TaxID=1234842 RepID=UPI00358E4A1F|nr:oleate hydratase [Mucilaginibacter phenanthrenivorans]
MDQSPLEISHTYFVGGGLDSLAGAVYLLEEGGFKGKSMHIIEALPISGGLQGAKRNCFRKM